MFYNLKQGCHFYTVFFVFVLDSSFQGKTSSGGLEVFSLARRESGLCLLGLALGLRFYTIS